jgi:hypothetical protein
MTISARAVPLGARAPIQTETALTLTEKVSIHRAGVAFPGKSADALCVESVEAHKRKGALASIMKSTMAVLRL